MIKKDKSMFAGLKNTFTLTKNKNTKLSTEKIENVTTDVTSEISKDFQNTQQSTDTKELNNTNLQSLQNKILTKKHITSRKKYWLKQWTDELVKNNNKAGLEQLDKGIDFTKKGGLIVHTPQESLKFEPKIGTFGDVKNIEGINKNENVWKENESSHRKGLRVNFEAVEMMKNAGKKICTKEQYISAINVFPGGDEFTENHPSTRAQIFFRLLGSQNTGFRYPDGRWYDENYLLWSSSSNGTLAYSIKTTDYHNIAELDNNDKNYGFSVWFLED